MRVVEHRGLVSVAWEMVSGITIYFAYEAAMELLCLRDRIRDRWSVMGDFVFLVLIIVSDIIGGIKVLILGEEEDKSSQGDWP